MSHTLSRARTLFVASWLASTTSGCASFLYPAPPAPSRADSAVARAGLADVAKRYWREVLPTRPDLAARLDQRIESSPRPVMSRGLRNSARRLSDRLDSVNPDALSAREYATYQTLRWQLDAATEASAFSNIDFSMMSVAGSSLGHLLTGMAETTVRDAGDLQRYLYLSDALSWWFDDVASALTAGVSKNVVASVDAARAFRRELATLRAELTAEPLLDPEKLAGLDSNVLAIFRAEEKRGMTERVLPALDSLIVMLEGYEAQARPQPGLWQYPGGKEYYRHLLRRGLGVEITPEEAHRVALSELARADSLRRSVLRQLQWKGTIAAFHDSLRTATATRHGDLTGIASWAREVLDPLRDSLGTHVSGPLPPLPEVRIASGMEALLYPQGWVRPPEYRDSSSVLLLTASWLSSDTRGEGPSAMYRWSWPGAALAASIAYMRDSLDPITLLHPSEATRQGWMEYGASLAGEWGLYNDPLQQYGRLLHEGWVAALLACDTGVHYLGWGRSQALALLRPWSLASPAELDSLFVEHVVRLPGTAGAAVLGNRELAAMRAWSRARLAADFDAAQWHRDILSLGPVPLPVLASYLEWWMYNEYRTREAGRRAARKK